MKNKKDSFITGAIILVIANVIVKLVGALFKIPLAHILGLSGLGIFTKAYNLYASMFVIATAGLPVAVSKMVSEAYARNNAYEANRIFKLAFNLLALVGLGGAFVLYINADRIAVAVSDPLCADAIRAISPAVFFVSIMSAFRGYFQGGSNMRPTAISEVCEALGKLFFGLALAMYLMRYGWVRAAAGANLGVSIGTVAGAASLVLLYMMHNRQSIPRKETRTNGQLLKTMLAIAIPITIGASVSTLTSVLDTITISGRLMASGVDQDTARIMFGGYSGHATNMFNMPLTLITALSMSIVPAIAGESVFGNMDKLRGLIMTGLRITLLIAFPCAVGLSVLSGPILQFVYSDTYAATQLSVLSVAIVFVSVVSVSTAILQALGKVYVPFGSMIVGGVIKASCNYFLVSKIGIMGAPISTCICYFTICVLNLIFLCKYTGLKLGFIQLSKSLISALAMGAAAYLAYSYIIRLVPSNSISLLVTMGAAACLYLFLLLVLGGIDRGDMALLPGGEKILGKLNRFL